LTPKLGAIENLWEATLCINSQAGSLWEPLGSFWWGILCIDSQAGSFWGSWEPLGASGSEPLGASGSLWGLLGASGRLWEPPVGLPFAFGRFWEPNLAKTKKVSFSVSNWFRPAVLAELPFWDPLGAFCEPLGAFGASGSPSWLRSKRCHFLCPIGSDRPFWPNCPSGSL
jgi:hypothetical protein